MRYINKKFFSVAFCAFAGLTLISCSNDLKAPVGSGQTNLSSPVSKPDVVAWSGQQTFMNTFNGETVVATRSEADTRQITSEYPLFTTYCLTGHDGDTWQYVWVPSLNSNIDLSKYKPFAPPTYDGRQHAVSESEYNYVMDWIDKNSDKGYTKSDLLDYFVQCVGAYNQQYAWEYKDRLENYTMNNLVLNENYSNPYYSADHTFGNGYSGNHTSALQGERVLCLNYPIESPYYSHTNNGVERNAFKFFYIDLPTDIDSPQAGGTALYLGFDFRANEGTELAAEGGFQGNGKYYDWVLKIMPADGSDLTNPDNSTPEIPPVVGDDPTTLPGVGEVDLKCKNCDHDIIWDGVKWVHLSSNDEICGEESCLENHEGPCSEPELHTDEIPGDDDTEDPVTPPATTPDDNGGNNSGNVADKYKNHVEVNFALNDVHSLPGGTNKYDIEDLVTKLSIHVRYPKDVEVIIPVPEYIYCDQDDLLILNDHYDGNFTYGGDYVEYPVGVGNSTVTLSVEFVSSADDRLTQEGMGYIRVWTNGINDNVINYCQENFGDGINFEIYNYYSMSDSSADNFGYNELQWKYLSHAFINFDWQTDNVSAKSYPEYFVNAFNQVAGGYNPGDCYVWIMGDDRANNGKTTYLNNGYIYRGGYQSSAVNWGSNSEKTYFYNAYQGYHFNGSPYNWIYNLRSSDLGAPTATLMPDNGTWPFSSGYPSYQQDLIR